MRAPQAARNAWTSYREFEVDIAAYVEERKTKGGIVARLYRANEWLVPRRLAIGAVILGAVGALFLGLLLTGSLRTFYDWLIGWTTAGEPWTHIMRDNPWIYWAGAGSVLLVLFKVVPRQAVGRLYLIALVFFVGFLGGHVFW